LIGNLMKETKDLSGLSVSPLSIVGFILGCGIVTAPIGLALCGVALSEIKHNPTKLRGAGLAKWGIGLSLCSFGWFVICGIAFQNHMRIWRNDLRSSEVAIEANRQGRNSGMLSDNLAMYEESKRNPPSFFNPFGI